MKRKVLIALIFIIGISLIQRRFFSMLPLNIQVLDNIVTFLSVVFGFYITSLAIFVTSRYVSNLYKITDKKNTSVTLLHTLLQNYKFGLTLVLLSLAYFIFVQFFVNPSELNPLQLSNFALTPLLGLLVVNFWYCYQMLTSLIKIILQEAKNKTAT